MSTHIKYEVRTARGGLIERHDLQARAEATAEFAVKRGMAGAAVFMVTTTITAVEVYRPDPPERPPGVRSVAHPS